MDTLEKDWDIFLTIAQEQNITKAANKLFISQPALSYRLTQLEKNFDEPLFIRTTKGVILTETGELYYQYALDSLKRKHEFEEALENRKHIISGPLQLGSSSIFANYELPSILAGFTNQYPHVQLHLQTGISSRIAQLFTNNDIHIGIIRGHHAPTGEKIYLNSEPICLVTSKDCNREALTTVPQIRYTTDPSLYTIMDTWWNQNFDTPPNTSLYVDTMATCRRFIQKNLGWSILPYTGLEYFKDDIYIEPLYWDNGLPIERETNLYYHVRTPQRKPVQAFINYMQKYIKNKKSPKNSKHK
ncbi:LysR family transcriptional regulator [Veillonella criceti]|uniref:Cyn operon transcriptional activator n=1 Tax=Veillonella criceti TaxID=103891 RepID=A0A380NL75_9FIRM|nr:LysR family transcriptional regulator [Veillonella criceti]SUP43793.1 Cyn operon transcriptional activator [Veillonella criceti]